MCVDYAAGVRFEERGMDLPEGVLGTSTDTYVMDVTHPVLDKV